MESMDQDQDRDQDQHRDRDQNLIKTVTCGIVFEHTSAIRPKCCAQDSPAFNVPSHTLIWNTLGEYGAVERSPVSVQFINASILGANQATAECLRVASVSVALVVLSERASLRPLVTDRWDPVARMRPH